MLPPRSFGAESRVWPWRVGAVTGVRSPRSSSRSLMRSRVATVLSLSEIARRGRTCRCRPRTASSPSGSSWGGLVRGEDGRTGSGCGCGSSACASPPRSGFAGSRLPYLEDLLEATTRARAPRDARRSRSDLPRAALRSRRGAGDLRRRLPAAAARDGRRARAAGATRRSRSSTRCSRPNRRSTCRTRSSTERALRRRLAEIRAFGISTLGRGADARRILGRGAGAGRHGRGRRGGVDHRPRRASREPQFALGVRMAARGISSALGYRPHGD